MDQLFNPRSLEERLFSAWPALHTTMCNGWLLRLSGGHTKRANSANPLNPLEQQVDFAQTISAVESFYQSHHQPCIFRITPLAPDGCDNALEQAGYRLLDPTHVMAMAFISFMEDDETVGYGLAVMENALVGLFDIVVVENARRRGIGRKLTFTLLQWAQAHGATGAYLQVTARNTTARTLYEQIGFRHVYSYHYRIAPDHNATS
jgi:ribosomal protein S18 acetylase RimI-like enzyme